MSSPSQSKPTGPTDADPGQSPLVATTPRTLSVDLQVLSAHFNEGPVSLAEVFHVLKGRGYKFLIVLLCLPFLTPIPLPGFSAVIGLVITLIGFRLALGQKPRLPDRLMRRQLPSGWLPRILRASSRLVGWFERLSRPRLQFLYRHAAFQCFGGILIALCGLKLMLPIPIPMSNFFPGLAAALLAAGSFEEDGIVFLAGVSTFVASLAYFGLLAFGGAAALTQIWQRLLG